jgi:hypothetical protein
MSWKAKGAEVKIENPLRAEFAASEQRLQRAIRDNGHRSKTSVVGSEWLFSSEAAIGRKSLIRPSSLIAMGQISKSCSCQVPTVLAQRK